MNLALSSMVLGVLIAVTHIPLLAAPSFMKRMAVSFPRDRWWGWGLTAVDLIWAAWLLNSVPLGRFEVVKDYLLYLTPMAFFAVAFLVQELLAARALGGLLVLVPAPLLGMARWHESSLRLVVVVVAYIMVVEGMVLLLSPYWFRKGVYAVADRKSVRWSVGLAGSVLGGLLIVLGCTVY